MPETCTVPVCVGRVLLIDIYCVSCVYCFKYSPHVVPHIVADDIEPEEGGEESHVEDDSCKLKGEGGKKNELRKFSS